MSCDLPGPDAGRRAVTTGWFDQADVVADRPRGSTGPRLLHADRERRVLVTAWVPGVLVVEGHRAEQDSGTYRQAGALLRAVHAVGSRIDGDWEAAADARALAHLDGVHRIDATSERLLRARIAAHVHPPVRVVPTHGDFQPRSWVVDDAGRVRVVDRGRFAWRPPATDLAPLDAQQLAGRDDLAAAFVDGYGTDLRQGGAWQRARVREAIGTVVRAHRVGDEALEAQGHRMVDAVLAGEVLGGSV
ncbi:phosphotransferase [Isoptericola halotolerans]|uniref:phosphotransferase family protein n=1 Tax=Isoptericola halotolerans TaxID=300560 RepID=UPI00388FE5E1